MVNEKGVFYTKAGQIEYSSSVLKRKKRGGKNGGTVEGSHLLPLLLRQTSRANLMTGHN